VVILPFSIQVPDDARRKLEVGTVQEKIRNQMRDIRTAEAMQRADRAPPAKPQRFTEGQHIYVNNHRHPKSGAHSPEWVQSEATFLSYVDGNKSAIAEMPNGKLRKTAIRDIAPRNNKLVVRRVKEGRIVEKPHREERKRRQEPEGQKEQRPRRETNKRRISKTPKEVEHPSGTDDIEPRSKRHKESKTAEHSIDHQQTEQLETKERKSHTSTTRNARTTTESEDGEYEVEPDADETIVNTQWKTRVVTRDGHGRRYLTLQNPQTGKLVLLARVANPRMPRYLPEWWKNEKRTSDETANHIPGPRVAFMARGSDGGRSAEVRGERPRPDE
jgi:hypothetical protein